jgi:hypothetical protein
MAYGCRNAAPFDIPGGITQEAKNSATLPGFVKTARVRRTARMVGIAATGEAIKIKTRAVFKSRVARVAVLWVY